MKRFLLFCGNNYYPGGGWFDYSHDYDTAQEAYQAALKWLKPSVRKVDDGWAQIVDLALKPQPGMIWEGGYKTPPPKETT